MLNAAFEPAALHAMRVFAGGKAAEEKGEAGGAAEAVAQRARVQMTDIIFVVQHLPDHRPSATSDEGDLALADRF